MRTSFRGEIVQCSNYLEECRFSVCNWVVKVIFDCFLHLYNLCLQSGSQSHNDTSETEKVESEVLYDFFNLYC